MTPATTTMQAAPEQSKKRTSAPGSPDFDVAIVGAGPYGLSAAAHLKAKGLGVCVFGEPMEFWDAKMPEGMLLRSPRVASTISDPRSDLTLEVYESATGTKPATRVSRETFVNYGKWFQKQLTSELDKRRVANVRQDGSVFKLTLSDGAEVTSRRVVVAAGVGCFRTMPSQFSDLPLSRASHCYDGLKLSELGSRVVVIGAGQSALECAALLNELGASAEVIAKKPRFNWIGMHKRLHELGPISKMLYSKHDIGPIGISRLVAYPNLMRGVPMGLKDKIRKRAVRAAGAPWLIPRLDSVTLTTGRIVTSAKEVGGELQLKLDDGSERRVDHILMGTGYRVDMAKYDFIDADLLNRVQQLDGYPKVASGFSTSVRGLHFIGAPSAKNFGPLMQFVTGTEFSSKELAANISRKNV